MDEIELRERIKKIIKEALTEANTINNDVEEKALEIYNIVCKKKLTDSDVTNKMCSDGTVQKIYSIHDKFLEKNILWTFRACMVNEDSYYEKLQQHETSFGTTYTDGNKITFITIAYYQTGKIFDKAEVFDSIQHELNHAYKALLVGKTMENDQFCAYINTLVNLPPLKENYYQKIIGDICYIGRKDEQDSFINGAYAFLKEKQPIEYPSAGSTFKRGTDFITAKLIDECGLKGYQIGGAQVSEKHAGFIINKGNATSKDVEELIKYIKQKVYEKFGKEIETEIEIIH